MSSRMTAAAMILVLCAVTGHAQPAPMASSNAADAATALTPESIKRIDLALGQAEVVVTSLEAVAKSGPDGGGCPANITVRKISADLKNKQLSKETGDDLPDSADSARGDASAKVEWQLYNLCQALAAKSAAPCADASAITPKTDDHRSGRRGASASYQDTCTRNFHKDRVRAAYIARSANFLDVCREALPQVAPFKDAAATEAACKAWLSGGADGLAGAITTGLSRPMPREEAMQAALEMSAQPGICAKLPTDLVRRTCREQDSYRKALAAGNASPCAGGICRLLMGGGAPACESYAKSVKSVVCVSRYGPDFVAASEKDFKAALDPAAAFIDNANPAGGDPKALKDLDSRLDRLYALRDRFQKASDLIAPKVKKGETGGPAAPAGTAGPRKKAK